MARTLVRDLPSHIGSRVTVYGWVDTARLQRTMQFVVVRDHTGSVQVTNKRETSSPEVEQAFERAPIESAVKVTGMVVRNEIVKLGGLELIPESVDVTNPAESPLPLNDQSGIDVRLGWRFLDVRREQNQLLFQVQTSLECGFRDFALARGATEMHTPKLMGSASESGAEVFAVNYFERTAYLAQSPQFFKQMAISAGIDKVFEIGPVFRAEPSFTSRHATEFTGLDIELAWIDGLEDVMSFEEEMLSESIKRVVDLHGADITRNFGINLAAPTVPFPRMTMKEALELCRNRGWVPEKDKGDLDPAGERLISSIVREKYGHEFVFITDFPSSVRPFYHMRPEGDASVTSSFDLIWNGIEITTGAQREHRYDVLVKQAEEKGIAIDSISAYLNSFRYGTPPHGGLGAGLGRILMVMLGLDSIREATFLFRGPNRLEP